VPCASSPKPLWRAVIVQPVPRSPDRAHPPGDDPNEYRAILRSLLHLGGQVDYTTNAITITLDQPDSPRVARALQLLTEELNATPTVMPTDSRPLTYQLATA
jgi:hypothetical protein